MADLALLPGPDQRFHGPARRQQGLKLLGQGHLVGLVEINIIRVQPGQAQFQFGHGLLCPALAGLGGDDELVPDAGKGPAHLFLAVQVLVGGIEKGDALVHSVAQHGLGLGEPQPNNGNAAEADGGNDQTGLSQIHELHGASVA